MTKILIIDDDPDMVESSRIVLDSSGYETDTAMTREAGMAKVESFKPDLILLDVMMEQPDDGIALAQDLRRKGIETPIVMLSGISQLTGMHYDRDDETLPVNAFLEKPIEPEKLLDQVKSIVGE